MKQALQPKEQNVSILFADICDSTPLYESTGDWTALEIIAECLDALATIAEQYDGNVIRSKGDDLLCTFDAPTSALDAAEAMIEAYARGTPSIHVGLHFGAVIRARQDIYGDAVNVAARMLSLAKPGEIVASANLVDALAQPQRERLAALGTRKIKGKQDPLDVYSIVVDEGLATQSFTASDPNADETVVLPVLVELEYDGQSITVENGERCLIGRAERCDLVLSDPRISREHAWVEVHGGHAMLTDKSTAGSWIVDPDGRHITLRRAASSLAKSGSIRLGRHPRDPKQAPEISFSVRRAI